MSPSRSFEAQTEGYIFYLMNYNFFVCFSLLPKCIMGFSNFFHKRLCPKAKFKRESLLATKQTAVRGLSGDVRLPLLKPVRARF